MSDHSQADLDNHANQCNPDADEYWESRGWDERPDDYPERVEIRKHVARKLEGTFSSGRRVIAPARTCGSRDAH